MIRKFVDALAFAALVAVGCAWSMTAWGQANNSNTWQTPGNQTVGGFVEMCLNSGSQAVPCSGNSSLATGTTITATGAGTTAATTATLAAATGKTTYICGFVITASATSATAGLATVATVVGGNTLTFGETVGTTPVQLAENFSPCIPANATNTGITVTSAAAGTGGVTNVSAWGFQF